jgi:hypothetical protein
MLEQEDTTKHYPYLALQSLLCLQEKVRNISLDLPWTKPVAQCMTSTYAKFVSKRKAKTLASAIA